MTAPIYPNGLDKLMTSAGMDGQALADKVGTTKQQINKLRHGTRKMTRDWAEKIAPHLDACPAEVIGLPSCAGDPRPSDPREIEFYEDLAWRLKVAVEAIDRQKGDIADSIGVSQSRMSNWITNQNKPDWFGVAKLCRRYGISADWVLLGELRGLPHEWADRWGSAWEERSAARRGPVSPAHESS
ncbi:transcriptional regulator [Roseomonas sp. NAR14]|uniref:Transcriptional regulator n=1 Tax=Roseomonas acroporae TaxID=2937791 RepID=A0A9X2BWZ6_9PROT|nr:helix-turn-helix transcriptional regulator [Roseomonas acroporae]MCK8788172.1 transcriptional regulator [Roseomonas acroporae]